MMRWVLGALIAAATGVVLELAGLVWSASLRTTDPALARREEILALPVPGHLLLGLGIALAAAGVLVAIYALSVLRTKEGSEIRSAGPLRTALLSAFAASLIIAPLFTMWVTANARSASVTGIGANSQDTHEHVSNIAAGASGLAQADGGVQGQGVPVSAQQLARALRLVEETRQAARRFEDINVAHTEGYIQYTAGVLEPAYFSNPAYESDGRLLDPERPEILIYAQTAPDRWRLVGVEFTTESPDHEPPDLGGPLTVWHNHAGLCFAPNGMLQAVGSSLDSCQGTFVAKTAWMVHVWLVDNPNGAFGHTNPDLRLSGAAVQDLQWNIEYGHMPVTQTTSR